jgi:hypothetical protein
VSTIQRVSQKEAEKLIKVESTALTYSGHLGRDFNLTTLVVPHELHFLGFDTYAEDIEVVRERARIFAEELIEKGI